MQTLRGLSESHWKHAFSDFDSTYQQFLGQHRIHAEYDIGGLRLVCPPSIYHPNEFSSTRFMLRGLLTDNQRWGSKVLDVGTGSGAIGLSLAKLGYEVTLLDLDPTAVACAQANAARNQLRARVLESDLFSAVPGERFDVIVFNIPMLDKPIEEPLDIISCDRDGALLTRYMREAKDHLAEGGTIYVGISNLSNRAAVLESLEGFVESILYAEYFGISSEWRWLVRAQPVPSVTSQRTASE